MDRFISCSYRFFRLKPKILIMALACDLCHKSSQEVRFRFLLDVNPTNISEWTSDIIVFKAVEKLCVACCRNVCMVGDLLFQWRHRIRISLESASNRVTDSLAKQVFCATENAAMEWRLEVKDAEAGANISPCKVNRLTARLTASATASNARNDDDHDSDSQSTPPLSPKETLETVENRKRATSKKNPESGKALKSKMSSGKRSKPSTTSQKPDSVNVPCPDCGGGCKSACSNVSAEAASTNLRCQRCFLEFPTTKELEDHIQLIHNLSSNAVTGERAKLKCPHCGNSFINLNNHLSVAHGYTKVSRKQQLLCSFCPKTFPRKYKYLLVEHERLHTNEKPFVCKVCKKGFHRLSFLKNHIVVHSGEKRYKCDFCDRKFAMGTNKIIHERTVHKTVRFPCPHQCGKSFIWNGQAKKHADLCSHSESRQTIGDES